MPVKKTKKKVKVGVKSNGAKDCCSAPEFACALESPYARQFAHVIMKTLFGILVVYLIVLLGAMIRNQIKQYEYIGYAEKTERTLRIEAQADVTATPDIAVTTMGMISAAETVSEAQTANTMIMNDLIDRLEEFCIEEEDIQTSNYNIYPSYNYTEEEGRVLEGYEVSQSITIKIRDLTKANEIIALAGVVGANSVSGLQFTIDDRDVYIAEAREKALEKVSDKAIALSGALGVQLGDVVDYSEYEGGGKGQYRMEVMSMDGFGGGGAVPEIEAGSIEVDLNVSVTFEIL